MTTTIRKATKTEWDAIVAKVRAANPHMGEMLASGEINWITEDGETIAPPGEVVAAAMTSTLAHSTPKPKPPPAPVVLRFEGKRFDELGPYAKDRLRKSDPRLFLAMKLVATTHGGKAWDELAPHAQIALYREDKEKALRMMRAAAQRESA